MPELAVILVNFKRPEDTIECVQSLRRSTYTDFEIIIVDNNSADDSIERLRLHCPDATLIVNASNRGFAEGNNTGIREALARRATYILLLNNDTVIDPDALRVLTLTMKDQRQPGIAGAKIYYFDRPLTLWFAGGYFNPHSTFGGHYGFDEEDRGQYDTPRTCDYITGCCLLFRADLVHRIGLLERSYFAYMEDAEFCIRARRAGYPILYQPAAKIYHKVSRTSSWDSPTYIYFVLRNKIIFLRRNAALIQWLPHLPHLVYFYIRQFVRLIFKWRDLPGARAAWLGLRDGLRNTTGTYGEGSLNTLPVRQ
jgi:GT2 family glycosyltransferase